MLNTFTSPAGYPCVMSSSAGQTSPDLSRASHHVGPAVCVADCTVEDDDLENAPAPEGEEVEDDEVSPAAAATPGACFHPLAACTAAMYISLSGVLHAPAASASRKAATAEGRARCHAWVHVVHQQTRYPYHTVVTTPCMPSAGTITSCGYNMLFCLDAQWRTMMRRMRPRTRKSRTMRSARPPQPPEVLLQTSRLLRVRLHRAEAHCRIRMHLTPATHCTC